MSGYYISVRQRNLAEKHCWTLFSLGRSALKCWSALDEIAVKIKEPQAWEVPNSSTYFNRKGWFAINTQAMCDSRYRFTFVSCLSAGSTHESTAYSITSLARLLEKQMGCWLQGVWVAADDFNNCMNRLLTNWPGRNLSVAEECFNYRQSSSRIFIEQDFGILVARWGILWRPLSFTLGQKAKIVVVCCKLRNLITDESGGVEFPPTPDIDTHRNTEEADGHVYLQDECDLDEALHRRRRDLDSSQLRQDFYGRDRSELSPPSLICISYYVGSITTGMRPIKMHLHPQTFPI